MRLRPALKQDPEDMERLIFILTADSPLFQQPYLISHFFPLVSLHTNKPALRLIQL